MTRIIAPDAALLLFDSGVGGLSIYDEVRLQLPDAPIVYAADFAGLPYGEKSEVEILSRVPALLGRLVERFAPRLAVIACNTASTIALDHVRSALNIPVVGTVPAVKPAGEISHSRVIGILGTRATVRQPYVDKLHQQFASDCKLIRYGAPELVEAAEMELRGERAPDSLYQQAVNGLISQEDGDRIDVMVLACTHFPLVVERLTKAIGREMCFIHGANGIVRHVANLCKDQHWSGVTTEFVTTGSEEQLADYIPSLKQRGFERFSLL